MPKDKTIINNTCWKLKRTVLERERFRTENRIEIELHGFAQTPCLSMSQRNRRVNANQIQSLPKTIKPAFETISSNLSIYLSINHYKQINQITQQADTTEKYKQQTVITQ